MKILGLSVPPDLEELFDRLITSHLVPPTGDGTAQTSKLARLPQGTKKKTPQAKAVDDIVASLAEFIHSMTGKKQSDDWQRERASELNAGFINPRWWSPCELVTSDIFESLPINSPDLDPKPYDYPDPSNLPSRPYYPDGSPASGSPRYQGALVAGYFEDQYWSWRRTVWLSYIITGEWKLSPIFAIIQGSVKGNGNARGSRPMLSLICKMQISYAGDPPPTSTVAPRFKNKSHYWRYELPETVAPFWHVTKERFILNPPKRSHTIGVGDTITLNTGVRPMYGRGFNNNTAVESEWTGSETMMQPNPCMAEGDETLFIGPAPSASSYLMTYNSTTDSWTSVTIFPAIQYGFLWNGLILGDDGASNRLLFAADGTFIGYVPHAVPGSAWYSPWSHDEFGMYLREANGGTPSEFRFLRVNPDASATIVYRGLAPWEREGRFGWATKGGVMARLNSGAGMSNAANQFQTSLYYIDGRPPGSAYPIYLGFQIPGEPFIRQAFVVGKFRAANFDGVYGVWLDGDIWYWPHPPPFQTKGSSLLEYTIGTAIKAGSYTNHITGPIPGGSVWISGVTGFKINPKGVSVAIADAPHTVTWCVGQRCSFNF